MRKNALLTLTHTHHWKADRLDHRSHNVLQNTNSIPNMHRMNLIVKNIWNFCMLNIFKVIFREWFDWGYVFFKVQWRNSWSIFKQICYSKKEKSKLKLKNPRNEILFGIYVKIKYTINNLKRKTYSIQCWRRLRPPLRSCSFISLMELLKIISIFVIFLNSKRVGNIFSWWTSGTLIRNHFTGHFICSSIDWWLVILLASSEFTINSHTRHQTRLESSCHWI